MKKIFCALVLMASLLGLSSCRVSVGAGTCSVDCVDVVVDYWYYDYYWYDDYYYDWGCDCYYSYGYEKNMSTPKDLEKRAAQKEQEYIATTAQKMEAQFGLSADRSQEVAALTLAWKKAGGRNMTKAEADSYTKQLLGFTNTELVEATQSNDLVKIDQLIEKAANTNQTSPEHIREIIRSITK